MEFENVVIVAGARTPFGSLGGSLKDVSPTKMAVICIREVIKRSGLPNEAIEEVIFGQVLTRTDENCLVPRGALLDAGLPDNIPAHTTIRGCGSGIQSSIAACRQIMIGDNEILLTGGVDNMSMAPYLSKDTRWGARLQNVEFTDSLWEVLHDPHTGIIMGMTAENVAEKFEITREEQDDFAYLSNQRALKAIADGVLKPTIVPVEVKSRKKTVVFDTDEHPKDTPREGFEKLPTVFKKEGGTVTAANSSGLNDGGSATILMSETRAKKEGIKPLGRIISYGVAALDPRIMGYGPVPSSRAALKRVGMEVKDIDYWEVNEAFASQYLCCEKELGFDREKANIWGGAIAYGHPVGATGNRLLHHMLEILKVKDATYGMCTMCIGGGQGIAMLLERL